MRHAEPKSPKSLARQIWAVLVSYFTRPGIRWAIVTLVAGLGLAALCHGVDRLRVFGANPTTHTPYLLLEALTFFTIAGGIVGLLLMFYIHARFQLMGPAARLIPNTHRANLIVAGAVIPLASFAIAYGLLWNAPHSSPFGVAVGYMTFLVVIGYVVCRPILLPIFIIAGFFAYRAAQHTELPYDLQKMTLNLDHEYADLQSQLNRLGAAHALTETKAQYLAWRVSWYEQFNGKIKLLRITVLLADGLALLCLALLARPTRLPGVSVAERLRRLVPQRTQVARPVPQQPRRVLRSQFSRRLHRRFAVRDWRAPGIAAAAMFVLGIWFNSGFRNVAGAALTCMLAFLPGALAAIGWRERWANFDFESLYPVSRREFVTDMAAGLLLEAAEFWIAGVIAVLATCAALHADVLHEDRFWLAILCSGMMQFLWIGAIFLIGQRRQTVSYVAGLTPFVLSIFLLLDSIWRGDQTMSMKTTLTIASVQMAAGVAIFLLTWAFLQRGRLATPSMSA